MLRLTGSFFVFSLGAELLGRAAVLTTAAGVKAIAKMALWISRKAAVSAVYGLGVATHFAACYLEMDQDPVTGRPMWWSEIEDARGNRPLLIKAGSLDDTTWQVMTNV